MAKKAPPQSSSIDFETGECVEDETNLMRQAQSSLYRLDNPYVGNKRKIVVDIATSLNNHNVKFNTMADVFSGSSVVGLFFKLLGKQVTSNDLLRSSFMSAMAFVENCDISLSADEIKSLKEGFNFDNKNKFVQTNYLNRVTQREAEFLDNYRTNIDRLGFSLPANSERDLHVKSAKEALAYVMIQHHVMKNCFLGGRLNSGQILAKLEHRLEHKRNNGAEMNFVFDPLPVFRGKNCSAWNMDCLAFLDHIPEVDLIYCMKPSTKIRLQNENQVALNSVKEGDILFGGRCVLKKMQRKHDGHLLEISATGMVTPLCVTPEHRILTARGKIGKQEYRLDKTIWNSVSDSRADEIKIGDYVLIPTGGQEIEPVWNWNDKRRGTRPRRNGLKFTVCPELYKLLGYYAAEGHINKYGKYHTAVIFSFGLDEINTLVADTVKCAKACFNVDAVIKIGCPHPTSVQVHIYSSSVAEFVEQYVRGTATNKSLHPSLMMAPIDMQRHILNCWLYGDGGETRTSRNRFRLTGTSASFELAQQMLTLGNRCGLMPCFKKRQNNHGSVLDVQFSSSCGAALGRGISAKKFRSQRRIINGYIFSRVQKIVNTPYSGNVIDLDVDGDNRFVADGILVHNCDPPYGSDQSDYASMFAFLEEYVYGIPIAEIPHIANSKKFSSKKDFEVHFRAVLEKATRKAACIAVSFNDSSWADCETVMKILVDYKKRVEVVNMDHEYKYRKERSAAVEYLFIAR